MLQIELKILSFVWRMRFCAAASRDDLVFHSLRETAGQGADRVLTPHRARTAPNGT